ncbi:MAG TPA: hypothetical protein VFS21_01830 [Roseiflexaceae bacterium]|nr:hypothetical protein [Roseiflexaceae bacterium]
MRFAPPKDAPWEPAFQQYLADQWQENQAALDNAVATNATAGTIRDLRTSLYVFAVGLVTFGRLDVVPFLLAHIPQIGKLPQGARVVLELLPVPSDLYQQGGWEAVGQWVKAHTPLLRWDSEQERFVLSTETEQP